MKKLAAIPFLILCSCIIEVPNETIVIPPFSPIDNVLGDYTIETTLLDISETPFEDNVETISDGKLTLKFDHALTKSQADIWSYGQWGFFPAIESPNPHLLYSNNKSSIVISLSKPVSTFGLELLPGMIGEYQFKVSFFSKKKLIGSITKSTGSIFDASDAFLFAASTNVSFDAIVIEGSDYEDGIAMAQFRYTLK